MNKYVYIFKKSHITYIIYRHLTWNDLFFSPFKTVHIFWKPCCQAHDAFKRLTDASAELKDGSSMGFFESTNK